LQVQGSAVGRDKIKMKALPHEKPQNNRRSVLYLLAGCWLLLTVSAVTGDPSGPAEMLTEMTDRILVTLRNDPGLLDDTQRMRDLADELILPNIDFHTASRWVLGKYWRVASPEQRDAFVREFRELLMGSFLRSVSKYQDNPLRILPARSGQPDGRAIIDGKFEQPDGQLIEVVFRLHRKDSNWLVYDIVIEGISLVATHRSGFAAEIRNEGLDSLIAHLVLLNSSEVTAAGVPAQESP
jgi:phospholipid transport system substrate-binding protein